MGSVASAADLSSYPTAAPVVKISGGVINGQIAFKSFMPAQGVWGSVWIGFKNFTDFFQSFYFVELLRNTIGYSLAKLIICVPLSILLAVTLYECTHDI